MRIVTSAVVLPSQCPQPPELLWSLGLAFTRKGDDLTYDDEEDEMVPNPALRKVLKASTCLSELARLDWT